jgi:glycosyltransferase involved in cell wall biosynthesis
MKINVWFHGSPKFDGNYTQYLYLKNHINVKGQFEFEFKLVSFFNSNFRNEINDNTYFHFENKFNTIKTYAFNILQFFNCTDSLNIIIPLNSPLIVSLIPFFNHKNKIIQIVNSDSNRTYKYINTYIDRVSKIICISPKQINTLKEIIEKNHHNKLILIPHGVKLVSTKPLFNQKEPLKIGYIGRIHQKQKNVFFIVEVLKKIEFPFEFILIGSGPDEHELISLLKQNQIKYKYEGAIHNSEISAYIKNWDIFLFTSTSEGFGITLIEAMNNGVVPIANFIDGVTDYIIQDNVDGFLVKQNKIEEYLKILYLLEANRELLHQIKKNAINKIQSKFDLNKVIVKYQEIFFEAINDSKSHEILDFSKWKPYAEYKPNLLLRIWNKIIR